MSVLNNSRRKTIRQAPNPMDRSTIVSVYPKDIKEVKHTIQPGVFHIPAGTSEKPTVVVIGPSSWWRDVNPDEPILEIPIHSIQIADSVINDYVQGLYAAKKGIAMPGLFFVPGALSVNDVKIHHKERLATAVAMQKQWFKNLIDIADVLWSRSNGNPLAISQDMRIAARELQMVDKPWMANSKNLQLEPCPACGFFRDNRFPVCSNCKTVVDVKSYKERGLQAAV